jgi:hypothetical protein
MKTASLLLAVVQLTRRGDQPCLRLERPEFSLTIIVKPLKLVIFPISGASIYA